MERVAKIRILIRAARLVRLLILTAVLWSALSASGENAYAQEAHNSTAMTEKRISPSEVTLSNLDAFEAQMRRDLPIGTPKQDVEAYLTQSKIRHGFTEGRSGPFGPLFQATIENIGRRVVFTASLAIRIHLDPDGKVDEITFRVEYL